MWENFPYQFHEEDEKSENATHNADSQKEENTTHNADSQKEEEAIEEGVNSPSNTQSDHDQQSRD